MKDIEEAITNVVKAHEQAIQAAGIDEHQFLTLAKKFAYHDGSECPDSKCMICEALGTIENAQLQLAANEYDKRWSHAMQNGDVF